LIKVPHIHEGKGLPAGVRKASWRQRIAVDWQNETLRGKKVSAFFEKGLDTHPRDVLALRL
jgi:hypothetical protein